MTTPEPNETFSASVRLARAACVVRTAAARGRVHAEVAGQRGGERAAHEGDRGLRTQTRLRARQADRERDDQHEDGQPAVLGLEERGRALLHLARDVLHAVVSRIGLHDVAVLDDGEHDRENAGDSGGVEVGIHGRAWRIRWGGQEGAPGGSSEPGAAHFLKWSKRILGVPPRSMARMGIPGWIRGWHGRGRPGPDGAGRGRTGHADRASGDAVAAESRSPEGPRARPRPAIDSPAPSPGPARRRSSRPLLRPVFGPGRGPRGSGRARPPRS